MKIRCIIADDEPIARRGLADEISQIEFLDLAGVAENALQANELLMKHKADLIFLDIQMPKLTGLEFLRTIKNPPMIIIITAHHEHAVEGFNLDVIDYLVKPVPFDRLLKACNKAKDYFGLTRRLLAPKKARDDFFFVKCDSKYEKIFFSELLFVEAADNYVTVHTTERIFVSYLTLKNVEEYLEGDNFIKVHKSFIVAIDKIDFIEGNSIIINKRAIPISRNAKEAVMELIVNTKLIRR